jgi:hypothetical protein
MRREDSDFLIENFKMLNHQMIELIKLSSELKVDVKNIKEHTQINTEDLKEHIKRTNLNERRIELIEESIINLLKPKGFFIWLKRNYKFIIGLSTLVSILIIILEFLYKLIF